jgi:hypothetical protein
MDGTGTQLGAHPNASSGPRYTTALILFKFIVAQLIIIGYNKHGENATRQLIDGIALHFREKGSTRCSWRDSLVGGQSFRPQRGRQVDSSERRLAREVAIHNSLRLGAGSANILLLLELINGLQKEENVFVVVVFGHELDELRPNVAIRNDSVQLLSSRLCRSQNSYLP